MAIAEVKVPQLSESVAEATLLQWKKKPGDAVAIDEILIEIETDKVVLEVPAPSAGVLVELDLQSANVSASTGQALFSVVQIALSNVERHADATQVTLRMASEDGEGVQLAVTDNGRGFAGQPGSASARGLKNLRHRIESLGGAFAVRSAPGEGTRIEARMPANPPEDAARSPRATTPP